MSRNTLEQEWWATEHAVRDQWLAGVRRDRGEQAWQEALWAWTNSSYYVAEIEWWVCDSQEDDEPAVEIRFYIKGNRNFHAGRNMARAAFSAGLYGRQRFWDGFEFLQQVMDMKKPVAQARRVLHACAQFGEAARHTESAHLAEPLIAVTAGIVREAIPLWIRILEAKPVRQLERSRTRQSTLRASERGVAALSKLRQEFERKDVEGFTRQHKCMETIDERLRYWHEQLDFIRQRISEEGT